MTSMPDWPLGNVRANYVDSQAQDRATAEQQAENSARAAAQTLTYTTTGTGQIIVPAAQLFDAVFLEPPIVLHGSVLVDPPGQGWAYPAATGGVYRWLTNDKGYVNGAYLYFTVTCLPSNPDDDPNHRVSVESAQASVSYERQQLTSQLAGTAGYAYARAQLELALEQLRRSQRSAARAAANPVVTHHLSFQGVAMKQLPESVTGNLH